jgi:hypothetical protein
MAYADVSLASTTVTNPVFGAATNFYFGSNVSGNAGANDQSSRSSASATAALGNAASETSTPTSAPSAVLSPAGGAFGNVPPAVIWLAAGGALLSILATIYFSRR